MCILCVVWTFKLGLFLVTFCSLLFLLQIGLLPQNLLKIGIREMGYLFTFPGNSPFFYLVVIGCTSKPAKIFKCNLFLNI